MKVRTEPLDVFDWLLFAWVSFSCFWLGAIVVRDQYRKDAIEHGAAKWTIGNDGKAKFEWVQTKGTK